MTEFAWKMEGYRWVADPLPKSAYGVLGAHLVDETLSEGGARFAEELAGECGMSFGVVRARLEELAREGKAQVEEIEYGSDALGPRILREHFTDALAALDRAERLERTVHEAHVEAHHDGDIGNALGGVNGGWSCDICRDMTAQSNEFITLEGVLRDGETEAASHFTCKV
jgi:hypothetical protein